MFFGRDDVEEYVSVVGTPAFMDFVESIKGEGVILEKKAMGEGSKAIAPTVIEVDKDNPHKDIEKLDIELPVMTPRIQREYKNLANLDVSSFGNPKVKVKTFSEEEKREIVFKDVVDEKHITPQYYPVRSNQIIEALLDSLLKQLCEN